MTWFKLLEGDMSFCPPKIYTYPYLRFNKLRTRHCIPATYSSQNVRVNNYTCYDCVAKLHTHISIMGLANACYNKEERINISNDLNTQVYGKSQCL